MDTPADYSRETGLPVNAGYFECGLPPYLKSTLKNMEDSWANIAWSELNADINSAEIEQVISAEQAWYLREKYLRMKRGD